MANIQKFFITIITIGLFILFIPTEVYCQKDSVSANLSFDLGITRSGNINLWPVFRKFKDTTHSELQIVYPLFSKKKTFDPRSKHIQILPLIIKDSNSLGNDNRYISLFYPSLFRFQKQTISNTKTSSFKFLELAPYISCIGVSRSPDGLSLENNIFFFIWYKRNILLKKTQLTVFPVYWYNSDTYHSSNVLFPIFWNFKKYGETDTLKKTTLFPLYWSTKTRDKNNKILFPLVYSLKDKDSSSLTVIPFFSAGHSTDLTRKYLNIFPVYFFSKTKDRSYNVLFPVFWNNNTFLPDDTVRKNTIFPLYWSTKSRDKNNKIFFPFVYRLKDKEFSSLTVFPILSAGHSTDRSRKYFNMFMLYWHSLNRERSRDIVFPLYWSTNKFKSDDTIKKINIFPLYWSVKSKMQDNRVLFPLVYSFQNQHYSSLTLFPLFSYGHSGDSVKKYFAITPLYIHSENKNRVKDNILLLFWNSKRFLQNDTILRSTLFPLYWSTKSRGKNNKMLLPFVFSLKNKDYSSFTVFPLLSYGKSSNSNSGYFAITPLYWHVNKPGLRKDIFIPLFWNSCRFINNDTIRKSTIFPLYWSVKNKEKNNHVLIPLIYSLKCKDYSSFTVFPFFSYRKSSNSNYGYFAITPLYWHLNKPALRKDIFFPLFWNSCRFVNNDTISKSIIFPLYWSTKSREENNKMLLPFVFSLKNKDYSSFTLLPFFSAGHSQDKSKRHFDIFPVYWHNVTKSGTRDVVFPLWWSKSQYIQDDTLRKSTLFPLYWSVKNKDKNNHVIIPLIYSLKYKDYSSLTVFPLFSHGKSSNSNSGYFVITPLYWHLNKPGLRKDIFFPLFWNSCRFTNNDTIRKSTLFPLYWSTKSREENNKVIFPIVYSLKNKDFKSFTIAPVFSSGHSTDMTNRYLNVFPLYWHSRTSESDYDAVFPLWWNIKTYTADDTIRNITLFPLYWSVESREKNYSILFPLIYNIKNSYYRSLTVFPLFSSRHATGSNNGYMAVTPLYWHLHKADRKKDVFFPLLWCSKRVIDNDTLRKITLFPVYWSVKYRETNNNIFIPLIYSLKNKDYRSLTVLPLFSSRKANTSNRGYLAITPFYWHFDRINKKKDMFCLLFWNIREYTKDDTIRKTKLFPVYWSMKKKDESFNLLLPILLSSKDKKYSTFTIFPLFSAGHSSARDNKYFMLTPFFGHFKNPDKSNTFLFPLFNYIKTKEETKSSWFLFVYRKTKKLNYSKTSVLWPICERLKDEGHKYFRIAPVVWYNKTDTSRMFSIQPFHYSYKNEKKKSLVLGWFLYKYENIAGSSVSNDILWKLFNTERYSNGDYETRFLYFVYANIDKQDKREVSVLPFYHKVIYPNGDRSKSVFFGMYNYFKQYKPELKESYEEERIFWFIRLRSNYAKLKSEGKAQLLRRN